MTDPVQRLREALNAWFMPSWSDVEVNVLRCSSRPVGCFPYHAASRQGGRLG